MTRWALYEVDVSPTIQRIWSLPPIEYINKPYRNPLTGEVVDTAGRRYVMGSNGWWVLWDPMHPRCFVCGRFASRRWGCRSCDEGGNVW